MKLVSLTRGMFAKVDDEDYDRLSALRWSAHPSKRRGKVKWYAALLLGRKRTYMHRMIMRPPAVAEVDHRNGDGLDNQKHNLRICNHVQNSANQKYRPHSSRYKGVGWCKARQKWQAGIKTSQKRIALGRYELEDEAARAYDRAAITLWGEFAKLNFPHEHKAIA